jgi:hypothetical protein
MERHAKELQTKAKKHQVTPVGRSQFLIDSSTSGRAYRIWQRRNGGFECSCPWSQYHDTSRRPCSHVLAVEEWLEAAGNRRLSFWADPAEAARQRRPVRRVGDGLWATSRRAA